MANGRGISTRTLILTAIVTAIAAVLVTALLVSVFQRKNEARNPFFRVVEITESTGDPAVWGKNFPLHYDDYRKTVDMARTRYGGSEGVPRTPTDKDPRAVTSQSRLEEDPRLKTMWAGYAFARDFREERGHAYMLEDQLFTERQQAVKQPGACINCHASVVGAYRALGNGDLVKGFDVLNKMPYFEAKEKGGVRHPVACIDCHDPATMQLRITRPAFMAGIARARAAAGVPDYDVNRDATRQEMRTYVCGQCHVEYYFRGDAKTLTYPWDKGLNIDNIMAYYDESPHKDWTHAESGADVLKAQHPEFELFSQGVHARSGVSCADCHMPYKREGAMKISDHHVQSPMFMINRACQTCHKWSEQELRSRVHTIQDRTFQMRNIALDALIALIGDIKAAKGLGASDQQLAEARGLQKRAQFYVDFIEAENSMGFHADQEAARVLARSIEFSRQGQVALRKTGLNLPVPPAPAPWPAPHADTVSPGVAPGREPERPAKAAAAPAGEAKAATAGSTGAGTPPAGADGDAPKR
jgi:nitrite reductase (cytochrome c-552)